MIIERTYKEGDYEAIADVMIKIALRKMKERCKRESSKGA